MGESPLTVEAWINPRHCRRRASCAIITSSSSGGEGISLQAHSFSIQFQMVGNRGNQYAKQDSPTALNRLSHVAGVFDGREIRLYIDGRRQQKSDVLELPFKPPTGANPTAIGAGPKGEKSFFDGTIGEVRISKVARYTADFTPQARFEPDTDTVLLYHLDEGTGDVAHDATGHGYDGTIVAADRGPSAKSVGAMTPQQRASPQRAPTVREGNAVPRGLVGFPPKFRDMPVPAIAPFDAKQAKAEQAAWAGYLGTEVEQKNSLGTPLVLIPPGEFLMGARKKKSTKPAGWPTRPSSKPIRPRT